MSISRPKIKVCHLASGDLWAGAEAQMVNLCRGLLETGKIELSTVVLNEGRLADELRSLGTDVTVIDERRYTLWQILWKLIDHARKRDVDILHTHRYKENILGSLAAKRTRVRHVVRTVHGTTEIYRGWKWLKANIYGAMDSFVCEYLVSGLIGVSREISLVLAGRFPGKAILHIPNCIDERCLRITKGRKEKRLELGLRSSDFVIGTVGRLTPVKGTEYLICAVAGIIQHRKDVRLLVVGDGPLRQTLEATVRSLGLEEAVTFLGLRQDCPEIMNALDLFVLPSLHEGTPTALLEAMCLGIPAVASATGGVPDLITHGETGFLVKPKDVHSLANTCLAVIEDPSARQKVASNCSRFSSGQYGVATVAEAYLSFYCRLLAWRDHGHSSE